MLGRQRSGSIVCPTCGRLVGVRDEACLGCGTRNPSLWGFAPALRRLGGDLGFVHLVTWGCGALFLASLLMSPGAFSADRGLFSLFSPDRAALFVLGSSGAIPVFGYGRWWTLLSAAWLHGGLLHIAFNLMWTRDIAPAVAKLYGGGRLILIWTAGSVLGFLASSAAGFFLAGLPRPLVGAGFTVGASAPIFGLFGALIEYGNRSGQRGMRRMVWGWVVAGAIFGLAIPGIDNWAHGGGFLGGWLAAKMLGPLSEEKPSHVLAALVCLVATAASIGLSIVTGLEIVGR
jgi:rhomboid protease GluP